MVYDVIIVGAGPAGLNAAVYAARYKLNAMVISKDIGGSITGAHNVENWIGEKSIPGMQLIEKFKDHVKSFGIGIKAEEVKEVKKQGGVFRINNNYETKAIILALGTCPRHLGVKGEKEFLGKGVSYCATCDAAFFRNKRVAVIGGANSAAMAALLLAEFADKVYMIYRKDKLRSDPAVSEKVYSSNKIEIITNVNIAEIKGDKFVNGVTLDNGDSMDLEGVFIEIGSVPSCAIARLAGVSIDEKEFIIVDQAQKTNIDGIFAAGDITTNSNGLRQVITAAAEGAVAAQSAYLYLRH